MENAQQEPSMEEILASIRRIISEDDEEPADETAQAQEPRPAGPRAVETPTQTQPTADATPAKTPDAAPDETQGATPAPAGRTPSPRPVDDRAEPNLETEEIAMIKSQTAAVEDAVEDAMLDESAADAASSAFRTLSQSVRVSEGDGKTLEDIVTEMVRPMIKAWLDEHLPAIVEEKVEDEVQRVARRRR